MCPSTLLLIPTASCDSNVLICLLHRKSTSLFCCAIFISMLITRLHYLCQRYCLKLLEKTPDPHNDNILQKHLFIILTSMEMVALMHTMSIVHFNVAIMMRWLVGSTHNLYATIYNWFVWSTWKAIDALNDGVVEIEKDDQNLSWWKSDELTL